jgi:hypothetical protein
MLRIRKTKMWRSKRGDDMLIDFWAIAVFAVILLLFFILFAVNKTLNDKKVQAEFANKDLNFMLESFLRAPALGVDQTKTVGEIITEDSTTGDFTRTEDLFKRYFKQINQLDNQNIIEITLKIEGDNTKDIPIEKNTKTGTVYELYAETYIPGYNKKVYVRLSMWSLFKPK